MENFETYRPLLFSIAYRMLGSAMEAEDMVQEAYVRYQATPSEQIRALKPFLTTVVTRLCLDQLKSAREKRETYVGHWLPEPIRTAEDSAWVKPAGVENAVAAYESVSMAFLILLETLTPIERAIFLLREVFDYDYGEIARMVGREEATCRQFFHRARQRIARNRSRFQTTAEAQERMTHRFLEACAEGTVDAFMSLLAEDVVAYGDSGGKAPASRRPLVGREKVARMLSGLNALPMANIALEVARINAVPAVVFWVGDKVVSVMFLTTDGEKIRRIDGVMNPDKLRRI